MKKMQKLWQSPTKRGGILFLLTGTTYLAGTALSLTGSPERYLKIELWDSLRIQAGIVMVIAGLVLLYQQPDSKRR